MNAGSPAASHMEPPAPARIGRYEVYDELGRGSTATVYRARDPLIGRWVALKAFRRDVALDPEGLASLRGRLLNEARSAGSLTHPGIVAIYDVVEHDAGRLSIAMEYVEGTDLRARLEDPEPLPLDFCARVVSEVAEVLDHAHRNGVVHRDVKPANILLAVDGSVKVTDFGIASLRDGDLAAELRNQGTPEYLAPERFLGAEADARSEVYSLGVVLYELLTRNPPFAGETLGELARSIVEQKPAPIDHFRPDLYPELTALVDRALAKEPEDRFASAGELAGELEKVLARRSRQNETVPTPSLEELELAEVEPKEESGPKTAVARHPVETTASAEPAADPDGATPQAAESVPGEGAAPRPRRAVLWPAPVLVGLLAAAALFPILEWRGGNAPPEAAPAWIAAAPPDEQVEYLRLLSESRRLFAAGDRAAALEVLDRTEKLSPTAARIRHLRDVARRDAAAERTALVEDEALDLLDAARTDLEAGRLRGATQKVAEALTLVPEHQEALRLEVYVGRLRARQLARERARQVAEAAEEPQPAALEPAFEPFAGVVSSPPAATKSATGDLRIDFYSERPRGVLTVYCDAEQILNRSFRFVEKKSLLRRKGIAGGFDERAEIAAGEIELRIYLSQPDQETQLQTVTGRLPAGSLRTLRVRVDGQGRLTTRLH